MELKASLWTFEPHLPLWPVTRTDALVNGRIVVTFGIISPEVPTKDAFDKITRVMANGLTLHGLLYEALNDVEGWRDRAEELVVAIGPTDDIP